MDDVVAQHHQRNRPPRLPDNRELMAVRSQQQTVSRRSLSVSRTVISTADDADQVEAPISQRPQATPQSTDGNSLDNSLPQSIVRSATSGAHSNNVDPSQLNFYAPPVRDVIERAKQFSHCDLASMNSFPTRPQFTTKAGEYINEAIVERRGRGLVIPEGKYYYNSV